MNPITIPNISIPTIGIPTIGIPSVGFPSASGGGGLVWPAGMKEHIKAWYDPKKQGMTNYDVIEAYVEDFTKWAYRDSRGIAKITNNTIVITNVVETNNIVEDDNEPYSDLTIRVTGVTENKYLIVRQGRGKPETYIKKDGVYTFKDNNLYFGFGISAIGECNITIAQLPTSILKDYSGNKHDAYLYGFKGRLNSGVGVYAQDFTKWIFGSVINNISTKHHNKIHIVKKNPNAFFGFTIGIPKGNYYNKPYKLKFNFNKKINDIKFNVVSTDGNLMTTQCFSAIINNGSVVDVPIISEEIFNNQKESNIYYDFSTNKDIEIDVKLIPDYPNQLCYDGKSYAVAYDMPILTDYTVMAERTWFEKEEYSAFISNSLGDMEAPSNGAFSVELKSLNSFTTISFGSITSIGIPEKGITYQTKQSYNGNSINVGTKESNDILILGGRYFYKNDNAAGNTWTGCHGAIIVADRSFTEEEINWLKQNWDKI